MWHRKLSLGLSVGSALALGASASLAQSPTGPAAAERCASFSALSERHGDSAREILAKAQEQAKSMPAADAEKFLALNKTGADSEWEVSALAREAYRKCMEDYLSGGSAAAPQTPAPAAPVQQQTAQPPVKQQPVKQAQPAKKPRPVQQQRVQQQQPTDRPLAQQQRIIRPVLPGLIEFGIGIGLGGYR